MIESAVWNKTGKAIAVTLDDGMVLWVPDKLENCDRAVLAKWEKEEGCVIQPYVPLEEPPPKESLEDRVAKLELAIAGKESTP